MLKTNFVVCLVLALIMAIVTPLAAIADMLVLESNVPEYAVGSRLPDVESISVPQCGRVKVLLSSNQTKMFIGECPTTSTTTRSPTPQMRGTRSFQGDPTVPPPAPR